MFVMRNTVRRKLLNLPSIDIPRDVDQSFTLWPFVDSVTPNYMHRYI